MTAPVAARSGWARRRPRHRDWAAQGAAAAGTRKQRRRLIVIAIGLLALLLALVALTAGQSAGGTLDPRSAGPDGARALAALLRERGVAVDRGTADRPGPHGARAVSRSAGRPDDWNGS